MRLGLLLYASPGANYRAIAPLKAMSQRGHEVLWPDPTGGASFRALSTCNVVHVYRRCDDDTLRLAVRLARAGIPLVFDNDDDHTAVPEEAPHYHEYGGAAGERRFAASVRMARLARRFTTPSEVLAERYRQAGVKRVEVIGNYLALDYASPIIRWEAPDIPVVVGWKAPSEHLRPPRRRGDEVVIGWIAAVEHRADAARLAIADALRRIVSARNDVRVECIGVDLDLPERYRHDSSVRFWQQPSRIAGFDIGIAPLADIPFNRARSDIKLKEYAALGVPWLASPVGPYVGLGEQEGGRLVPDDGWYAALERLVSLPDEREALAHNAKRWASTQTFDVVADRWEKIFTDVARPGASGAGRPAAVPGAVGAPPKVTLRLPGPVR